MAGVEFAVFRVATRTLIPAPPVPGTAYFVADEGKILVRLTNDTYEEYGGASGGGGGGIVVDSLAGSQTDAAPSVRAVKVALTSKADLVSGKLDVNQLPDLNLMYRGAFTGADATTAEAALNAAHPTDELGAYASVIVGGTPSLYVWTGTAWTDTGVAGVWVESINSKTGPIVTLTAADVGALTAADITGKEDKSEKGAANGYAPLGADSKVPAANLPDVIDGGNASGA
jgi:hypothetical protein